MSKRKKLIIYTDGSYADGKGGWAFHISYNKNNTPWFVGYGSSLQKAVPNVKWKRAPKP